MKNLSPKVLLVNDIVSKGKDVGIAQVKIQDKITDGRTVIVNGKQKIFFGNCSYLGIEYDNRVKKAAIEAIENYGVVFSTSRIFAEIPLINQLESKLSQIFKKPSLVAPTTSLGHISNIPVLVSPNDVIILDHQVHTSVSNAVQIVKANGVYVETMRHNRIDILEEKIKSFKDKYNKIWYMTDGVYSIYGDSAPLAELYNLMDKYEQFWCYIDDAHGMSWAGENGAGFALSQLPSFHNQMLLATSLAKGFGVCGAALIYPNEEFKTMVRNCGPTLMFSGPPQPSTVNACIASCDIHLSNEIYDKQTALEKLMSYFIMTAKGFGLPLVSDEKTPIFYIGVGSPESGYEITKRMLDSGFLLSLSTFPSVPYKNAGLRIVITTNHTFEDIYELLSTIAMHLEDMEKKKQVSKQAIFKAFAMAS